MISNKVTRLFLVVFFQTIFLLNACGDRSKESAGTDKPDKTESKPAEIAEPYSVGNEFREEKDSTEVNWGSEVNLNKMIEMAKKGQIVEIEWHVMPNILRARTSDGEIFHLRNENKGVDLRNKLIEAGVKIGRGGVEFRHVF